jgi:rare lipoprotein A
MFLYMVTAGNFIDTKETNTETENGVKTETEVTAAEANIAATPAATETETSSAKMVEMGTMTASWYGPGFHGRTTANGEVYDQMALTAAHKDLPFGTMLLVTNPRNGRSAFVRINDRGPYIDGRDLDLSQGTAAALKMIKRGVIEVKVEEVILPIKFSPSLSSR